MNTIVRVLLFLLFPLVRAKYKTIWSLKLDLSQRTPSIIRRILLGAYWKWCSQFCAWIGLDTVIKGTPILPHDLNGIFISNNAVIGKDCIIFHQVTIGSDVLSSTGGGSPVIGENVYIGAGAKIIGSITIGDNCRIGANACVYKDVPANCVVVGNPMRIIQREKLDNTFYTQDSLGWRKYEKSSWVRCESPIAKETEQCK